MRHLELTAFVGIAALGGLGLAHSSGGDEQTAAPRCPLQVLCTPSISEDAISYSIINLSRTKVEIPRRGLPFRMNFSGAVHLVALRDGARVSWLLEDKYETGIPFLDDLAGVSLAPGEAFSGRASVESLFGTNPVPGKYDICGIWRVHTKVGDEHTELSVPIPFISLTITGRR